MSAWEPMSKIRLEVKMRDGLSGPVTTYTTTIPNANTDPNADLHGHFSTMAPDEEEEQSEFSCFPLTVTNDLGDTLVKTARFTGRLHRRARQRPPLRYIQR